VAATVVVAWIIFAVVGKSKRISQEDNYAAGAAIPAEKYAYTVDFYNPLYRMIKRYLRDIFDEFYYWLADRVADIGGMVRRLYVGDVGVYVIYILLFLSVLFVSRIWWIP
jgi:NADH-quinone oxidoreductase subunit M